MVLCQVDRLYTGPQDSDIAAHMRAANPAGPLVVHIAKLFPKSDCSAFDAFGRILSGSIKPGDRVRSPPRHFFPCHYVRQALLRHDVSLSGAGDRSKQKRKHLLRTAHVT